MTKRRARKQRCITEQIASGQTTSTWDLTLARVSSTEQPHDADSSPEYVHNEDEATDKTRLGSEIVAQDQSDESMHGNVENVTLPPASAFEGLRLDNVGRDYRARSRHSREHETLSIAISTIDLPDTLIPNQRELLSPDNTISSSQAHCGCGTPSAARSNALKRVASSELQLSLAQQSPARIGFRYDQAGAVRSKTLKRLQKKGNGTRNPSRATPNFQHATLNTDGFGCDHPSSQASTLQPDLRPIPPDDQYVSLEPLSSSNRGVAQGEARRFIGNIRLLRSKSRYPGLILQPESSRLSQDQLAAEVKGIYGGLVMVEAKCINIDAAQAADPSSSLGPEQWQALIALHRTLLYEHHDFLMATQHPSANPALRELAHNYSMPARMWRHGIHAMLEVLRYRLPGSQDYMVAFVYLAYQMMALVFETVPTFTDTWIECLGDLARYRMAIAEDKEIHTNWGTVAASWYNSASDRHPSIGRLYHHLGILERPKLRKFFLYAKSLTCLIPFVNARDSLGTLCTSFVQSLPSKHNGMLVAEACMLTFHAHHFIAPEHEKTSVLAWDAISGLNRCSATELRDIGVFIVVTNVATIFELGSTHNVLWQIYGNAINAEIQACHPPAAASEFRFLAAQSGLLPTSGSSASALVYDFFYSCFESLIEHGRDPKSTKDVLRALHAILAWLHSLHLLRTKLRNYHDYHTLSSLLSPNRFPWSRLCGVLNVLCRTESINPQIVECARMRMFPESEESDSKPLLEDYQLRGLIWTHWYYPVGFFGDSASDEEAHMETSNPAVYRARVERVQWIALYLGFHGEYIEFNNSTATFSAPSIDEALSPASPSTQADATVAATHSPVSRSLSRVLPDSDGLTTVEKPISTTTKSLASVVSNTSRKRRHSGDIQIVDDNVCSNELAIPVIIQQNYR